MKRLITVITISCLLLINFALADVPPVEQDLKLCANYSVWLDETQSKLVPFNKYLIKDYKIDRSVPGHERMIFDLPLDLTAGTPIQIVLTVISKTGDTREFEGESGKATCVGPWKKMTCNFQFVEIKLDKSDSSKYLKNKYGSSEKSKSLHKIAKQFSGDPIGVAQILPADSTECL